MIYYIEIYKFQYRTNQIQGLRPAGGHPDPVPLPQSQAGSPFFFISNNFFRDRRSKYQLKYCMASSILVVLYNSFIHTTSYFEMLIFSTYFQNDVPLDTRTAPGGPQGKVGAFPKQFQHKMEKRLQKIVSGMTQQKS